MPLGGCARFDNHAKGGVPVKAVFYPSAEALLCYHYFSGAKPTHVYLAGIGLGSTGLYPSLIYGSELACYHTLMPDFLGYGYSDRPDDFGYTVDAHADSIAFLLDQLQTSQCTVIGHSFGGAVAIVLATKRPDLVARLVLAEAVLDAADWFGAATQSEEQYIASGHNVVLDWFRQGLPYFEESGRSWWPMEKLAAPSSAFYRTLCSLAQGAHPTWREQLYQLDMPRLFIFGDVSLREKTVSVEDTRILRAYGIQVVVIPKAWHNMMSDNPLAFARAIAEFEARDSPPA
jgi:pimeloyl-ACP methyl ester carboxylesterase